MESIKVLVIGGNDFAASVINKLYQDQNSQSLDIISISKEEDFSNNAENIYVDNYDINKIVEIAMARQVSLTINCEAQLFNESIVDSFHKQGLSILGPDVKAAELESSRYIFKEFCLENSIQSASYVSFNNKELSLIYLETCKYPVLLQSDYKFERSFENKKFMAQDFNEAKGFVESYFSKLYLSKTQKRLVIEEYIEAKDINFTLVYDGYDAFSLIPVKNVYEFNKFDFTFNEMAAFSSETILSQDLTEQICSEIVTPCLDAFRDKRTRFTGILNFHCKLIQEDEGEEKIYLDSINSTLTDLNARLIFNLLDENLFDLFFTCSQKKLSFYKDGLHHFPEAAAAYNLLYDYSLISSLSQEDVDNLELAAKEDQILLKVQTKYDIDNSRDIIQLISIAKSPTEAKNYALKTMKELDLAGKEFVHD